MATRIRATCGTCPFDRTYPTKARAEFSLRQHSCDRHNAIAASKARGAARAAAVDRTPKPCLHKQARHQHGDRDCYVLDQCRCGPCCAAASAYELNRTRQHAYGRWKGLVDAQPARDHVTSLTTQGMGLKRIVAVSDVSQGALWKLIYGKRRPDGTRIPSARITPSLERRILAIRLDPAHGIRVDVLGASRRIQALIALGWSQSKIATELGILPQNFTHIVYGRSPISRAHDLAIRALYETWSMQLPPAANHRDKISVSRARNSAKTNGWAPPLAWDDSDLDDPAATPTLGHTADQDVDEVTIQRRAAGERDIKVTPAEAAEIVRRLTEQGLTKNQIERQTGINPRRYSAAA